MFIQGIGFGQQQVMQGAQPVAPSTGGFRPPVQASVPKADGVLQSNQQKSSAPILDDFFLNQKDNGRQKSGISKSQEPLAAEEKVMHLTLSVFITYHTFTQKSRMPFIVSTFYIFS